MAEIKVYKLYMTQTSSGDAGASLDIQEDGEICAILLDVTVTGADALNDGATVELSLSSVSGFGTNDTRASLIGLSITQGFLTSGGGPASKNAFITFAPHGIPVAAGERIYLHGQVAGTATSFVRAWVYYCVRERMSSRAFVGRRVR